MLRTDIDAASARALARLLGGPDAGGPRSTSEVKVVVQGAELVLPAPIASALARAADLMGAGQAVTVVPLAEAGGEELSVQEAAACLNVSRPYVRSLMEKGLLPFRMVGTHHRLPAAAVEDYRRENAPRRRAALAALLADTDEHGE